MQTKLNKDELSQKMTKYHEIMLILISLDDWDNVAIINEIWTKLFDEWLKLIKNQ